MQKFIEAIYLDGKKVLYNFRNFRTNNLESYTKVTTWRDGTPMDMSKVDDVLYKVNEEGEFFKKNGLYVNNIIECTEFGIDGNSGISYSSQLKTAIESANGKKIIFEKGKTYEFDEEIITESPINIDGNGAKFVLKNPLDAQFHTLFRQSIPKAATEYDVVDITFDADFTGRTLIQINGDLDIKQGTLLKIFSHDLVTNPNHDLLVSYMGEWITVADFYKEDGNTFVWLQSEMYYNYQTTIKIVIFPIVTLNIENVRFECSGRGRLALIDRGSFSTFRRIVTHRTTNSVVTFFGCYMPKFIECDTLFSEDAIGGAGATGTRGYGVDDRACYGMIVKECSFFNQRHGYTTNGEQSDATDYTLSGGCRSAQIVHNNFDFCQYAIDTHAIGLDIVFESNIVTNSNWAIQNRSLGLVIRNNTIRSSRAILTYANTCEGMLVEGNKFELTSRNYTKNDYIYSLPHATSTKKGTINVFGNEFRNGRGFQLNNITMNFRHNPFVESTNKTDLYPIFRLFGSVVRCEGNYFVHRATSSLNVTLENSQFYGFDNSMEVIGSGTTINRIARPDSGSDNVIIWKGAKYYSQEGPTLGQAVVLEGSGTFSKVQVDWKYISGSTRNDSNYSVLSMGVGGTTSDIDINGRITNISDEEIIIRIPTTNITTDLDFTGLTLAPSVLEGQKLTIFNDSQFQFKMPSLGLGSNIINPGESITYMNHRFVGWKIHQNIHEIQEKSSGATSYNFVAGDQNRYMRLTGAAGTTTIPNNVFRNGDVIQGEVENHPRTFAITGTLRKKAGFDSIVVPSGYFRIVFKAPDNVLLSGDLQPTV